MTTATPAKPFAVVSTSSPHSEPTRDPYRGVVFVLLAAALLGAVAAYEGGLAFGNPVLLDAAVTLGLSAGVLIGVGLAQGFRLRPRTNLEASTTGIHTEQVETPAGTRFLARTWFKVRARLTPVSMRVWRWVRDLGTLGIVRVGVGAAGLVAIGCVLLINLFEGWPTPLLLGISAGLCLGAAALAATAAHYLADIEPVQLPEAPGLCRGARVVAWILVLAAASIGLEWAQQQTILRILHFAVLAVNAALCYGLLRPQRLAGENPDAFPLDLGALAVLGSRKNVLASILDSAEAQLGIDLRSTWALTVVRRSVEPLAIGLFLIGWLSTSLTVVGLEEQGLVERLGVLVQAEPLSPGLHLNWPWPIDQVLRIPVKRVQVLTVGHEGQEDGGPENVLWAREHAANEYTLLLGNGRDLITIDASVQFRIRDVRAWRYNCQNPTDAMRALAYRAVMRNTVNRTLSEALSENVATLTGRMRAAVQQESDALGLGVEVLGFTVGGMHPPVAVAKDYQAVVSAELRKVTTVVEAQVLRNRSLPAAEAFVVVGANMARSEGAESLARAAGEAWSFRALESQYRASPLDYLFRRRLETLEKGLLGRNFTVVDSRFQRDGGELWIP